jgi:hypothetical protein
VGESVLEAAIEAAIRQQLSFADQPLEALRAIAAELRVALDGAALLGDASALALARRQFEAALRKIWQESGGESAFCPLGAPPKHFGPDAMVG